MYTCINCGIEVEELYRKYSPSVLKVLKCVGINFNNSFKIIILIYDDYLLEQLWRFGRQVHRI